jgi:hypothetical protein
MPTFICTECGCIDNTACGSNYHPVMGGMNLYKDPRGNTKILCAECTPMEYVDGTINKETGKWHNKFPKQHWLEVGTVEEIIAECNKNQGDYVNAVDYFSDKQVVVVGQGTNSKMRAAALMGAIASIGGYVSMDSAYSHMKSEGYFKSYGRNRPDLMPKKEQGRNEKCSCHSGLKYKNCCGK